MPEFLAWASLVICMAKPTGRKATADIKSLTATSMAHFFSQTGGLTFPVLQAQTVSRIPPREA
jgi:hypothetical protein